MNKETFEKIKKEVEQAFDTSKYYRGKFYCKVNTLGALACACYGSYKVFKITDAVILTKEEMKDFRDNMLEDRNYLNEKGGTRCDLDFDGKTEFYQLSEEEREVYYETCYALAVFVTDGTFSIVVDPQGYSYARYSCLEFEEVKEDSAFFMLQQHLEKKEKENAVVVCGNDKKENDISGEIDDKEIDFGNCEECNCKLDYLPNGGWGVGYVCAPCARHLRGEY